jgi:hypothetical protein
MEIVIYVFGGGFLAFAALLFVSYYRIRLYGSFLLGVAYAIGGMLAVAIPHWWPLLAGFALAWLLRIFGMDPGTELAARNAGDSVN